MWALADGISLRLGYAGVGQLRYRHFAKTCQEMAARGLDALSSHHGFAALVDASDLVSKLRLVKSPAEIA